MCVWTSSCHRAREVRHARCSSCQEAEIPLELFETHKLRKFATMRMQTARQTRLEAVLQHSGSVSVEKAAFMPCVLRSLGADVTCEMTAAARVLHVLKGGLETGAL